MTKIRVFSVLPAIKFHDRLGISGEIVSQMFDDLVVESWFNDHLEACPPANATLSEIAGLMIRAYENPFWFPLMPS